MLHGRKHFNPGSQCCQNFSRQVCDLQLLEECCEPRPHLKAKSQQQLSASVSTSFMWFPFSMRLRLAWNLATWRNTTLPQRTGWKTEATQVLLMFYYTFVSGYAGHGFPNLDSYGWWKCVDLPETNSRSEPFRRYGCSLGDFVLSMFAKWTVASDIDALVHAVWAAWCCKGPCILQFCPGSTDHHNWGVWSGISQHMSWRFLVEFAKFHWDDPAGCDWRTSHGWSTPLCERPRRPKNEWWFWDIVVRFDMHWYALMYKCQSLQGLQEIECQTWQIEKKCLLPTVRAFVCKTLFEAWISMLRSWSGGQRVQTDLLVEGFSQRMIDLGSCTSCISRAGWDRNAPFRSCALMCDWLRWQPRLRSWWDTPATQALAFDVVRLWWWCPMTCPFSMWGTITPLGPQWLDCMDTIFAYCKTRVWFEVRYSQFCLSPWTTGPLLLQGLKRCNKAEPKSTLNGSLFYSFTITLLSFCDLRTWNWVTLAGQACSFLVYVSLNSKRGKGQTSEEWFETYPGFSCSSTAMWNGWRSISSSETESRFATRDGSPWKS